MAWGELSIAENSENNQLKAAYIINFARFSSWPESALESTTNLYMCVLMDTELGSYLELMANRKIKGRDVVIVNVEAGVALEKCHLVYFGKGDDEKTQRALNNIAGISLITMSDISGFVSMGGMVEMLKQGRKYRFIVDLKKSEAVMIRYRSELLEVSEVIR